MGRFRNHQERDATREKERREAETLREERREAAHHAEIAELRGQNARIRQETTNHIFSQLQ